MIIGTQVQSRIEALVRERPLVEGEYRRLASMGETFVALQASKQADMERLFDITVGGVAYSVYKRVHLPEAK